MNQRCEAKVGRFELVEEVSTHSWQANRYYVSNIILPGKPADIPQYRISKYR